ncbi:MAG: hypothetical protein NWE76_11030 [Candidatus Bathyarchaeota archaeon]|nr:hypothetical protein [Candidatus Bathyarchaeota archaeon]
MLRKEIPQIVAIVSISQKGMINIKKKVRQHLTMDDAHALFLDMRDEILFSAKSSTGYEIPLLKGNRIRLPDRVLGKLGVDQGGLVGLVQRENAVAIKKVEIIEKEGEIARLYDIETATQITRVAETNPMPEKILPQLKQQHKGFKPKYDVRAFLKGRQTLEAWKARRILGISEASDEKLRKYLVSERLGKQMNDGSWEGRVTITARNLSELADLGMTKDDVEIQRAVEWLTGRPQSPYNPGMFFAFDELLKEQQEVVAQRRKQKAGSKPRFNQRRGLEVGLVRAGDRLIGWPCGPRITWTTALVLEALLKLGYEENERVQAALRTLSMSRWCDNAQQHGLSGTGEIQHKEPYSTEELEKITEESIREFRYGGVRSIKEIERADMAHIPFYLRRVKHTAKAGGNEYVLRMPEAGEGCPVIMTRALSQVKNERLRRLAEAQLWKIAASQHSQDTSYSGRYVERFFKAPQAFYLQIFARYDHPVSELAIMRMIPWIEENQNRDGSWGTNPTQDATTLAVVSALKVVELI